MDDPRRWLMTHCSCTQILFYTWPHVFSIGLLSTKVSHWVLELARGQYLSNNLVTPGRLLGTKTFWSYIAFSVSAPHLFFYHVYSYDIRKLLHSHSSAVILVQAPDFWFRDQIQWHIWHLQSHVAYAEYCPDMKLLTHMPSVRIRSPWLCFVFTVQIREITYPSGKWAGSQYKDFSSSRTCAALFTSPKWGQ